MPAVRQNNSRRSSSTQSNRPAPTRLENVRREINQLFTGRSRVGKARSHPPGSPKTPHLLLGLQNFSQTRLVIPYLNRTATSTPIPGSPTLPPRSAYHHSTPISSRPDGPNSLQQQTPSAVSTLPSHVRHSSARRFVGVDPAEVHLAELVDAGRRRRKQRTRNTERTCAPKVKNKLIRRKILACFVSGLFLTLVLTVYLTLSLTNRNESQEFHVLLILIILVTTIFFCHALIRLSMMIIHPAPNVDLEQQNLPNMVGPGGYANPTVPIRVALAGDEEAAGIESPATKFPPPAYGLWRESVRVDPNRIFWQRNEAALDRQNSISRGADRPATANRPPSYISENGIDYVVEAAPRSIAPTTNIPLLVHPSERGRVYAMI